MAGGSQAEREFATVSKEPIVTVAQTTRELKQADPALWLRTGRGVREANVTLSHLLNMALGVAAGPPSKAVENVRLLRSLVSTGPLKTSYAFKTAEGERAHIATTLPDTEGSLFSGVNAGADLETFIHWLAFTGDLEKVNRMRRDFVVMITTGSQPSIECLWRNALSDGWDRSTIYRPQGFLPYMADPSGMIRRPAFLDLIVFECLARLWRDSAERSGLATTPSYSGTTSPGSDDPRNENAAPGRAALRRPRTSVANGSSTDLWQSSSSRRERQGYARGLTLPSGVGPYDPPHSAAS